MWVESMHAATPRIAAVAARPLSPAYLAGRLDFNPRQADPFISSGTGPTPEPAASARPAAARIPGVVIDDLD